VGLGCSWAYDQFGNRWQQNAYNGLSCNTPQLTFSGANNRADQLSYNAAGQVTNDIKRS
jgi:hypothetical protein